MRYIHLVLADHHIVTANGTAAETYLAGSHASLAALGGLGPVQPARPLIGASAARGMLAASHGICLAAPVKHASIVSCCSG